MKARPAGVEASSECWRSIIKERASILSKACREQAQEIHLPILDRLVSDGRMEGVWRQIYRQKKPVKDEGPPREFFYPVDAEALFGTEFLERQLKWHLMNLRFGGPITDEGLERLRDAIRQADGTFLDFLMERPRPLLIRNAAAAALFDFTFYCTIFNLEVFTPAQINKKSLRLHEIGSQLEAIYCEGASLGFSKAQLRSLRLIGSDAYVRADNHPESTSYLAVDRQRTDPQLRAFAILMTVVCRRLFGSHLYGSVACLANVALNRSDIDGPRIRKIIRGSNRGNGTGR